MLVEDPAGSPLPVRPATEPEIVSAVNSIYSRRGSASRRRPKKLTPAIMRQIERKRAEGLSWERIAKLFGVARNSIYAARRRAEKGEPK